MGVGCTSFSSWVVGTIEGSGMEVGEDYDGFCFWFTVDSVEEGFCIGDCRSVDEVC